MSQKIEHEKFCNKCGKKIFVSDSHRYCNKCFALKYPQKRDWDKSKRNYKNCNKSFFPSSRHNIFCTAECRNIYYKEINIVDL